MPILILLPTGSPLDQKRLTIDWLTMTTGVDWAPSSTAKNCPATSGICKVLKESALTVRASMLCVCVPAFATFSTVIGNSSVDEKGGCDITPTASTPGNVFTLSITC